MEIARKKIELKRDKKANEDGDIRKRLGKRGEDEAYEAKKRHGRDTERDKEAIMREGIIRKR